MSTKYCLIYSTGDSKENLEEIASKLLEKNLIVCANIIDNVKSIYKWQGEIESANELSIILKAKSEKFTEISSVINEVHKYDCPAIVQVPIDNISNIYKDFLEKEI